MTGDLPTRTEAIARVLARLDRHALVTANGDIAREAFATRDRAETFYMLGSMGQAGAIGLGLARGRPDWPVVVLDGDGNLIMGLAAVAMIADQAPANLTHVVLDNESYGSTGGQRSLSERIDLAAVARAAGYAWTATVRDLDLLNAALAEALGGARPAMLVVKVASGSGTAPAVPLSASEIAARFMAALEDER